MPNEKNQIENNTVNPIARHNARRYALQALYQWQMQGNPMEEIEAEFLRYHINKKIDSDYFKEIIHGVIKHQHQIDQEMQLFIGRPQHEIDAIELAVIRIATFEILKRPDVPYPVIINEALELTKQFGSVEGYKFVNGVLDRIAKKNRETEAQMGKKKIGKNERI